MHSNVAKQTGAHQKHAVRRARFENSNYIRKFVMKVNKLHWIRKKNTHIPLVLYIVIIWEWKNNVFLWICGYKDSRFWRYLQAKLAAVNQLVLCFFLHGTGSSLMSVFTFSLHTLPAIGRNTFWFLIALSL